MLIENREFFLIKTNGLIGSKIKRSLWFLDYMHVIHARKWELFISMKTQKHSLQLLYDEEGYCYGNSEWFISSVDMSIHHRLFMETLFRRHNICYLPQNITKLGIQAYMSMSRR